MSSLSCSVESCATNKNGCCCRPSIQVEGKAAHECAETTCHSYQKKDGSASNASTCCQPNTALDVSCTACSCVHYKNDKCTSQRVAIERGRSESQCATFKA